MRITDSNGLNVQFQKILIVPRQKKLEFPGGVGDSLRPKHLHKCIKLIEISRVVGEGRGLEKSLTVGEE